MKIKRQIKLNYQLREAPVSTREEASPGRPIKKQTTSKKFNHHPHQLKKIKPLLFRSLSINKTSLTSEEKH